MATLQELANEYDFNSVEDYFYYIVESEINGQRQQVKKLINKMQTEDKKTFIFWVDEQAEYYTGTAKDNYLTVRRLTINSI